MTRRLRTLLLVTALEAAVLVVACVVMERKYIPRAARFGEAYPELGERGVRA